MSMKRYESSNLPSECPKCGSTRVAKIVYGLPVFSDQLNAAIKDGRKVLGGCCITGDDPAWKCLDCKTEIYREKS
mgnify:CR=1 FL=1